MNEKHQLQKHTCNKCYKEFALKWRLSKHKSIHDSDKNTPCHYYNNNKVCPFEELGCKFAHKLSGECKYSKACKNKLCSFEHGKIVLSWGHQSECDLCEFQYKTNGEIYTHKKFSQSAFIY